MWVPSKLLLAGADVLTVLVAVVLTTVATPLQDVDGGPWVVPVVLGAAPLVALVYLARQRLYATRFVSRRTEELRRVVRATASVVVTLAIASQLIHQTFAVVWLAALFGTTTTLLAIEREAVRRRCGRLRRLGVLRRPVVVVGANQEARELASSLDEDQAIGYQVLGFVTDDPVDVVDGELQARVLGAIAETKEIVERTGAVGVIIVSTAVTSAVSNHLARRLTDAGIHVELTSTLQDIAVARLTVAEIGQFPTLYVEPVRRDGWRAGAKRAFDLSLAMAVLVVTAPLLLGVAALVKMSSSGPVLFRQVRVGRSGELFKILKFRTMVADAESRLEALRPLNEASGPLFKMSNDPRVTPVGRFLRRTSIDELPQFWNVLRGEMSLVGPRPALPSETIAWEPALHDRLRVKPGITGMWQISGRSDASFDQYTRLDLRYVDNWSLVTDLAIVLRTVPAVLSRRGAL